MFTFVLSSGLGNRADFFDQLTDFFGGHHARGQASDVAQLNGKRVTQAELQQLRAQRQLANDYIIAAVSEAQQTVMAKVEREVAKLPPGPQQILQGVVQAKKNPLAIYQGELQRQLASARVMLNLNLSGNTLNDKDKQEALDLLNLLEQMAAQDVRVILGRQGFGLYFDMDTRSGPPNDDSLLDFMVMQVHADRLHLKLTTAEVKAAVNREVLNGLTYEKGQDVDKFMRSQHPSYTADQLFAALGEEFRVRMVRSAYFNAAPRLLTDALQSQARFALFNAPSVPSPGVSTPRDLWNYFREARTELQVAVVPLDVSAYLPKVTGEPTTDELRKLFEQYKKVEPVPDQATPGFKQPRQVRVQFLSGKAEMPYYRKTAAQMYAAADGAFLLGNALSVPVGGGFVVPALQAGVPLTFNVKLQAVYQKWLDEQPHPWGSTTFTPTAPVGYRSLRRPEAVRALVGQLLGAAGTHGALALNGPLGWMQAAQLDQVRRDGQRGSTAVLTALGAAVSPLGQVSAVILPRAVTPARTPLSAIRAHLEARLADEQTKDFFIDDLERVRQELERLGKEAVAATDKDVKKQKEAAFDKYLHEEAAKRGLTVGIGTKPDTQYELLDDPGLKPLHDLFTEGHPSGTPVQTAERFADFFMSGNPVADTNPLQARSQPTVNNGGPIYLPRWYPGGSKPLAGTPLPLDRSTFLVWKTADKDAQMRRFDEPGVRDQVKAAWRLQKARDLAEQDARKLAEEAKAAHGDLPALKDFAAHHQRPLFELGPIAQQLPVQLATAGGPRNYQIYSVPHDRVTYPSAEFVDRLLKMRDAAIGATAVLHDQPKDHFYVAILTRKNEPTEAEFDRTYFAAGQGSTDRDSLFRAYEQTRTAGYRAMVMEQLRLDAGLQINTELRRKNRSEE